jgi:hypothetical protein
MTGAPLLTVRANKIVEDHVAALRTESNLDRVIEGGALLGVGALGCLRSLRARLALDGVSWVQDGLVEIAVGRWSLPGRRSLRELGAVSCLDHMFA